MTLEDLKAAYPAWAGKHKNACGYRYCANCDAREESCGGCGVYSMLIPQEQNHPFTPHFIRFYDEIGDLCLKCAKSLPLTGSAAQQLKSLLHDPDVAWYERRAREAREANK